MNNWKRTFAILWTSQFISLLTSSIVGYAMVFWLSVETRSAEILAFGVLAGCLPQAVLGLFVGVYVDRWNRKKVMIIADLFIAFCTLLLCGLLLSGSTSYAYFYVLFACRSIGSAFHTPALQASIPLLAPEQELVRIAGINQSIQSVCNIVGPVIGAMLIGFFRIEYILLLDVFGAFIACTSLLFIAIPNPVKKITGSNLWAEIKECFMAIRRKTGLTYLFTCFTLVMFAIMPVAVLFPLITVNYFGGSSLQMGLIEMIWGLGALAGGIVLAVKRIKINDVLLINAAYVLLGIYLVITGFLPANGYVAFAALTVIGGISLSVCNALFVAIIQRSIAPDILGRVFSVFFSLTLLPSMAGISLFGFWAESVGITTVFVAGGLIIGVAGVVSLFVPSIRGLGEKFVRP